jgi:hypothetical protein
MIAGFTISTIAAVYMLQFTAYNFSWADMAEGLQFKLPPAMVAIAFGAFGITGVGADEIVAYNYWCIEKGYAAYTGPRNDSPEWERRARGWINVMYLDAIFAAIIYTGNSRFLLLGAAVLETRIFGSNGVINTGTDLYTITGSGCKQPAWLVLLMFSSVFLRSEHGQESFIFGQLGWILFRLATQKSGWIAWTIHYGLLLSFISPGVHDHLRWYCGFCIAFCDCVCGHTVSQLAGPISAFRNFL